MVAPRVSVIMPSFNHGPFIADAIQSVLRQDFGDFELLIEDDGSSDDTEVALRELSDSRISVVLNTINRGAGIVTNNLLGRARGDYVALINSDDLWVAGKLHRQVSFMDKNIEIAVAFSRAKFIDAKGVPLNPSRLSFGKIFDQENRSRGRWLRQFFFNGNCLCNPSMLARRTAMLRAGGFDNRLRQLPDLDYWVRMAKREQFYIDQEPLVSFRIAQGRNVSSDTPANAARTLMEHAIIAENFFEGVSIELLCEGFGDLMRYPVPPTPLHIQIEKTLLYFAAPGSSPYRPMLAAAGYRKLFELMSMPEGKQLLLQDYDLDDKAFHELGRIGELFR